MAMLDGDSVEGISGGPVTGTLKEQSTPSTVTRNFGE